MAEITDAHGNVLKKGVRVVMGSRFHNREGMGATVQFVSDKWGHHTAGVKFDDGHVEEVLAANLVPGRAKDRSREDDLEFDVTASLADIKRRVLKTMVNESALGVYVIAWKAESATMRVIWAEGLDGPQFTTSTPDGRTSPARPIRHPERLGWQPPRDVAAFKAFVLKFMAAGLEPEEGAVT